MVDPAEYRRFLRRPIAGEFKVRSADDTVSGDILFDAFDISEGGALLQSDYLLEVGDELEVAFALPDGPQIIVKARVAWVTRDYQDSGRGGMGIEFIDLGPGVRDAIAEFVRDQVQLGRQTP